MPDIDHDQHVIMTERTRIAKIENIVATAGLTGDAGEKLQAAKTEAINGAISFESLQSMAIDMLRASRPSNLFSVTTHTVNRANSADHLAAALMVRCGYGAKAEQHFSPDVMQQSRPLHSASIVDLCRAALVIDGKPIPHTRDGMLRASVSSGSMPIALGSVADKVLFESYRQAPASWRSFAKTVTANNFKVQTGVRPSFFGDLEEVAAGGMVKHGSFAEETYEWRVGQYAKQLGIDRKQMIDDDLSAFSEILPSMAKSAARTLNKLVITTLLANDGGDFFSLSQLPLNYFEGAGTNLQATQLTVAIRLLRQMKDAEGNLLDMQPHALIVPVELEMTARGLLQSAEISRDPTEDSLPTGNVFQGLASLIVEPRLSDTSISGSSSTAWYLFSEPSNGAVVVGFLEGQEMPFTQYFGLDADINRLSFGFRIVHDFGAALGDHRAAIKSKGAA